MVERQVPNMDIEEKLVSFLRSKYYSEMIKSSSAGKNYIVIDFSDLDTFDPGVADQLLENPRDVMKKFDEAVSDIDLPEKMEIRIRNIPQSHTIRIRNLRSKHLGKLISIEGIVKSASEVKPQVEKAYFKCPDCGTIMEVEQESTSVLKRPKICTNPACRRRGGFELVDKKLYDVRWIRVIEPFEITEGEKPGEITVILKKGLTVPEYQRMTDPGNKIKIVGILKEIPKRIKDRESVKMDMVLEAIHVERSEKDIEEIEITPEDEAKIKELAADPEIYNKLVQSIAPGIYGFEEIKEAIALQLFGGVPHILPDGSRIRGNIHILITGDPGVGKSVILNLVSKIVPRGKYVSGKGVSGAGLTATVRKDEELGGWVLEAGALVLANNGLISIDEFDKMNKDDMVAMHEAMSIETISIAKASIVATLPARTSVLAGANPKFGRFDPFRSILEQIQIPDTLMSRFDLKFVLKDKPDRIKDEKLAEHISKARMNPEDVEPVIDVSLLRKYIAYAKRNIKDIKMTPEVAEELKKFYVDMRNMYNGQDQIVPITLRQYEALIRLAEASAKIQLRDTINKSDVERAIKLMKFSLEQLGRDTETGRFDIDKLESGISSSQRSRIREILEIIEDLDKKTGEAKISDIKAEAQDRWGMPSHVVDELIDKLKNDGSIYEPRHGILKKL